jgi:hypothetical protein
VTLGADLLENRPDVLPERAPVPVAAPAGSRRPMAELRPMRTAANSPAARTSAASTCAREEPSPANECMKAR